MAALEEIRSGMRQAHCAPAEALIEKLVEASAPSAAQRHQAVVRANKFIVALREDNQSKFMDALLLEYGLSSEEGVALMCLAESLLRVPDAQTVDLLIQDKIVPANWQRHLSDTNTPLINSATRALSLTGHILSPPKAKTTASLVKAMVRRLGEPAIRNAVTIAVKIIGREFVLGRTIKEARVSAAKNERNGFTYSYDMLGEAAMTADDASGYFQSYLDSITELSRTASHEFVHDNAGISVKLSALDPSFDIRKRTHVVPRVAARLQKLCHLARDANIGLNVDAEEMNRLDLSLEIVEQVFNDPYLSDWEGFGVVVQAYGKRAPYVLDWLYEQAKTHDRRIMVRLVKGAYWDTEIKQAQVDGVSDFPVFTNKAHTDISYLCCANKLLSRRDRIYPQFATHNAHTVASILEMAEPDGSYEFQRLHGMGEALFEQLIRLPGTRCRIYAPVGAHRDLLAYLVRRLLENGANSSFVNQVADLHVAPEQITSDPFNKIEKADTPTPSIINKPGEIYAPARQNSHGWDVRNITDQQALELACQPYRQIKWHASPRKSDGGPTDPRVQIVNPAAPTDVAGYVVNASAHDVDVALTKARTWDVPIPVRADILLKTADGFERSTGELISCLRREAGKTVEDAISEVREAVDFLRYYAAELRSKKRADPLGTFLCISPWNFPLAIFTGQIAAALAAGNAVIAKPAEQTPLIAQIAIDLMHSAGVPETALQLLPGEGKTIGPLLTSDSRIDGVCFTGSTSTAQQIAQSIALHLSPSAPFIAETGGINAMIIDSTCLLESAVLDVINSAFQSAGQRCSALRMLYVQADIFLAFKEMLFGAMEELIVDDPKKIETDIGPIIDLAARHRLQEHIDSARCSGTLLKDVPAPQVGCFVAPTVIEVQSIADIQQEIFGPVLHLAPFEATEIDQVMQDINSAGYGLTFGIHTRMDSRADHLSRSAHVGNVYVNRNQIGAVVGSQPFGGHGLSGTGPKAGGPNYLDRFCATPIKASLAPSSAANLSPETVQAAVTQVRSDRIPLFPAQEMPGPTGETNTLTLQPRGLILCLGPSQKDADDQSAIAENMGCPTLRIAPSTRGPNSLDGTIDLKWLATLGGFAGVAFWGNELDQQKARQALSVRRGAIVPLMTEADFSKRCVVEKLVCIDTTAAGGNATLLAGTSVPSDG